jgi:cytochrome c biogenesis protein CcdA
VPARDSLRVVHFYKPGCAECNRARQYINSLKTDFPLLELTEHNILESSGLLFNQSLCTRLDVPSAKHSVAPAIFTQAGYVIGPDISPAALGKLFADTMTTAQDDGWLAVAETEQAAAAQAVDRRYENITMSIVLIGGLLDGINPCAFATIIFFLSYLQVARRTPREMLMVGAAFILAVFLAYLAAGLALHSVLARLTEHVQGIQKWLNWIFGGLALLAAVLSARDAVLAHRGRANEMTLKLPARTASAASSAPVPAPAASSSPPSSPASSSPSSSSPAPAKSMPRSSIRSSRAGPTPSACSFSTTSPSSCRWWSSSPPSGPASARTP